MSNEALKISDVAFVVTSQIERAPHWTMFRELTMNALEAAARASGEKIVHWTTGTYKGVRKAVIWNTGPGMNDAELKAATDLACEINKSLGLDENFGVGAKVSSLASNKLGMRFRSCKAGRVSEVILGYDPYQKLYVRFERELPNGATDTVIDVTAAAIKDGRKIDFDWTEVMLFGNSEAQDTATRPFANALTEKHHVATALYRRFYRLPEGVKLRLDPVYQRYGDTTRSLVAIAQRTDKFARAESVPVPELNITIHFLHDPPFGDRSGLRKSSSGALGSSTTTCCLVHKDEMYSVMTGPEWSAVAPRFGIPFGSKELCVHIEIADDDARPSQYRERLISPQTSEDIVPLDFAICVRERMPEWVKEVIRNASPRQTEDYNDLQKELQELLNKYKVKVVGRRMDTQGEASADKRGQELGVGGKGGAGSNGGNGTNAGAGRGLRNTRRRFHETPEGATVTSLYEIYEKPPKITMLVTSEQVLDKGLKGRAAEFIMETGDLFVNGLYEAVDRTVLDIEPEFVGQAEPEQMRELITGAARRALALRVGKATVYALAKRANEDWGEADMLAALSKESLSIAADNYDESLPLVKRNVRERIKIVKMAA
jgi:hypothetical protein